MVGEPISMAVAGLSSIKSALDITKTLADARDATKLLAVKLELQGLLLEAQEAQAALVEEKRELTERIRKMETWEAEKERYELASVGFGAFAYVTKADNKGLGPPHMLCANCFKLGHPALLQYARGDMRGTYECHACKAKISTNADRLRELGVLPTKDDPAA